MVSTKIRGGDGIVFPVDPHPLVVRLTPTQYLLSEGLGGDCQESGGSAAGWFGTPYKGPTSSLRDGHR